MLGFYDFSTWLTYLSLVSAGIGIVVSQNDGGHPYIGVFFLLICGLCDAFDGKVARMKKNRTDIQKNFGIQIDSLSDLVAFGVLPACIGNALIKSAPVIREKSHLSFLFEIDEFPWAVICRVVMVLYMLAALIRLAYFNVTEEERQKTEGGARKFYEGLPVTSAALIFPIVLTVQYAISVEILFIYFVAMLMTGIAFLSKFKLVKPGLRGILIMVAIGAADFLLHLVQELLPFFK